MRTSILGCASARVAALSAMLALAVVGCGGGGDSTTPTPPGGFSIAVSPAAATVTAASVQIHSLSIARTGSFTGAVALRVQGAPAGVTTDISPASVPSGSTSADFLVSAAASTVPGTYPLTIIGSASGQADRSVTFTLTVTPEPGNFTITVAPVAVTVRQGQSSPTTVTVTRSGSFTGAVTLAIESAPNGVTGAFTPTSIPAGSTTATLTISASSAATPGNAVLTVRGTGSGIPDRTVAVALTVTPDPGSFTIAASPTPLSIEQRLSGAATVSVVRVAPFAGAVALALEGLPSGVTATPSPASIASGATSTALTISVSEAVAAGNYPITVRGTATGVPEATAAFTLTVTPSPGGFTIAATPVTVQQGQIGTVTVTITRVAPFTGAVTLVVEGAPVGVTPSLVPAVIPTGQSSTQLTYSVLATVPVAVYPITIRGTGTGVPARQVTQNLTVLAPPAGNVTFRFCQPLLRPVWLGYQNGSSQWTQVAGTDGTYNFSITADKGGVAFVMPVQLTGGAGYDVMLVLGTRAELIEAGNQSCGKTPPTKVLTGTLAGRGPFDVSNVTIGTGFVQVMPTAGAGYQMLDAELGVRDLLAVRSTFTSPVPPSAVILRRNTNYAANSAIPLLDFSSLEAFTTTPQTVTVTNGGANELRLREAYVTAGGTVGWFPTIQLTTNPATYQVMPPAATLAGDVYSLRIEAREAANEPLTRVVTSTFATATAQTLALGPALLPPTSSNLQAAPFYQVRVQSTLQPEYNKAYFGRYRQPTRTGAFYATAGYIGGNTVDITTPDLTTVPGWQAAWGPLPGISTNTALTAFGWTGASNSLFPGWFGEVVVEPGVVLRSATLNDVMTP